jgi:hypothetical protein
MGEEVVRSVNHTVSLAICASAQHGFVGQFWSGPGVGIRPTRCPLRPAVRCDEPEERLKGERVTEAMLAAHPAMQRMLAERHHADNQGVPVFLLRASLILSSGLC